jgi:hypothetical protein
MQNQNRPCKIVKHSGNSGSNLRINRMTDQTDCAHMDHAINAKGLYASAQIKPWFFLNRNGNRVTRKLRKLNLGFGDSE